MRSRVNRALARIGLQLVRARELRLLESWAGRLEAESGEPRLPVGAREYLRPDNPRLLELRRRYRGHPAAARSQWTERFVERSISLHRFRADNAFLWQRRASYAADRPGAALEPRPTGEVNYALSTYYALRVDRLGLLERLREDGLFGAQVVRVDDELVVSRDLLDSVLEINFLDRQLGLSALEAPVILDIGAGYGRLAQRLAEGLPNLGRVICTDGVPESSFVCEYYLRFRQLGDAAIVAPLDEIAADERSVDIAVNVHSFSECPHDAIEWWLDLLLRKRVKHLLIVPNTHRALLSREASGRSRDYAPLLWERGYRQVACEPKYGSEGSAQRYGIYPTYYHVFELAD